ncbi:regulatory protein RecX [Anaerotalea alkaliphila]|uniref:Regulatory protein RecX n=1 Tax=Anaerotalea alkaliphila TaxID=2662126 RepID=A0A7X5HTI9_9FIRM|nr:regulatory protein RecX [Anaerotalea alkaliphila]NDL66280.1 regulatory protein RecX [Anaerotalea alkaliphila]
MRISKLLKNGKKTEVFLDGKYAFFLYGGEVEKHGLREGEILEPEIFATLHAQVLARGKRRTYHLLGKRDHTSHELRRKLVRGGYAEEDAEAILEYFKEKGFVDDVRYLEDRIRQQGGRKSKNALAFGLRSQGLESRQVEQALVQAEGEGLLDDRASALDAARKKVSGKWERLEEMAWKRKLWSHLQYKGYSHETIGWVWERLQEECLDRREQEEDPEDR